MHPYILEAVARERIADMHAVAAAYRLAREAAGGRAPAQRKHRSLAIRRRHRVELVWPDGVSSVVELPRQSAPADGQRRGLAGSRR
jgi:hypothetical protein